MMVFNVEGMSCQHCIKAITKAVQSLDAEARVMVDLSSKEVRVDSIAAREAIVHAITEEGYQVIAAS